MFFKGLIKFASYSLMLGVCIILGFLSFTGIYVLAPILPLAIIAFFLSVIYEGEIYQQNITKAIKSLLKPNYLASKVAEDCLLEVIEDIQLICDFSAELADILGDSKDAEHTESSEQKGDSNEQLVRIFENIETITKKITISEQIKQFINDKKAIINARKVTNPENGTKTSIPQFQALDENELTILNELNLIIQQHKATIPQFFSDYARIANLSHEYSHHNLNTEDTKKSQRLKISLTMMEKVFTEQLFPNQSKNNQEKINGITTYKKNIRTYLAEHGYTKKYAEVLARRKPWAIFNKVLASICGVFMILGTSYLLVEAFTVIPVLSTIPFATLPIIIVPLAIIAGSAYGIITYCALDEMLNSDIITSRIDKIKQDYKEGLTLYTSAKILAFTLLLGLAITLTVCTGGTWYNVIKHTKPIFNWLGKIPAAVVGFISSILAVAALAFNVSNSAQTSAELEEFIESKVPEDHPYNIDLLDLELLDLELNESVNFAPRTAIIRRQDEYIIHYCPKPHTERNLENWETFKVGRETFLFKYLDTRLDFNQKILYFSASNLLLYLLIKFNTEHKFRPSKENWLQFFNPARFFLLITYVPLRIVLFLGHLVSISATADRVPGIPEIITMLIGFVAEFFEDLHYFADFEHEHKSNVAGIVGERLKEGGGHDHSNDLPTRILRDYLFAPFFMAAAAWHSYFSDRKKTNDQDDDANAPSISYQTAYEQMRGKPISSPELQEDKGLVEQITQHFNNEAQTHREKILDEEDLCDIDKAEDNFLEQLIELLPISNLGVFAAKHTHCNHHEHGLHNTIQSQI